MRRSPTIRTATAARFSAQNGGTNTFFDFSTFQDVEVSTGGSLLEQQNSGVTINVVTKRGTNELKGSARYLYASGNWQSNNEPQEAVDQGLPTNNTRMIREYGADLGGPIIQDKLWLWGSRAPTRRSRRTRPPSTPPPARSPRRRRSNLEPFSAKLNWQISNANATALYYQTKRPRAVQPRRGAVPSAGNPDEPADPDQLLQGRRLERLLVGPLRLDLRELPEPRLHSARQRESRLPERAFQARLLRQREQGHPVLRQPGRQQPVVLQQLSRTTSPRTRRSRPTCRCRSSSTRARSTTR